MFGGYFDRVIEIYQDSISNDLDGYITERGVVNWRRAEILFSNLGDYQIDIFRNIWS